MSGELSALFQLLVSAALSFLGALGLVLPMAGPVLAITVFRATTLGNP